MNTGKIVPPDETPQADIARELARAVARFGPGDLEIIGITGSWGATMDDHQVLDALRKMNRAGDVVANRGV